mgnify:CR=1 FL=1
MILKETEFDETSDVSDGSSSYNEDEYVAPNNEEDYQQSKRKRKHRKQYFVDLPRIYLKPAEYNLSRIEPHLAGVKYNESNENH